MNNLDQQVGKNTQAIGDVKEVIIEFKTETREHRRADRKRLDWVFYLVIIGAATGLVDLFSNPSQLSALLALLTP